MKNRHEKLGEYIIDRCYNRKEKQMEISPKEMRELEALVKEDMAAESKDKDYQKYIELRSNEKTERIKVT